MKILIFLFLLLLSSCVFEHDAFIPKYPNSVLPDGDPIPAASRSYMEGVYKITSGGKQFGDRAVLKWHGKDFSMFSETQGCYFVMKAVHLDSVIFMEGYWRYSSNNTTGLASLRISKANGSRNILSGKDGKIVIQGTYGIADGLPDAELVLEYERPFSDKVKQSDFYIMAHRSGGRNSDNLPASENSIEMIRYTRNFGTTGIEIDVRLTKDGVPIIYHDDDLNVRTTTKSPLIGPVKNFTWLELSSYVRLIHGEKIPTLEQALTFLVDSTELRAVWLDMKGDVNAMKIVIPIQQKALARARAKAHPLEIWVGLPTEDVIDDFLSYPGHEKVTSLCELAPEDVRKVNASVWSPRWTLGTQVDLVKQMHAEGRKVFCWTIDDQQFMKKFIDEGEFDGLLSNYSAMTAFYFYTQE
ncbi:MAG TPA: glycerophosphodiester phosphodiesterase [Cyclobacteriaceae bacterium]|nr:glycerophosphodiester phosphodiesterase [Cyclobacteriaceae bacterium]